MLDNTLLGTAKVTNGKIIIINAEESSQEPYLCKGNHVSLMVDDEPVRGKVRVNAGSKIDVIFPTSEARRELNINISEDKMEARISIEYTPEIIYSLEDTAEGSTITLNGKAIGKKWPPKYTKDEIVNQLKQEKIVYGLDMKAINDIVNKDIVRDCIVALGKLPKEPIDDILNIYFENNTEEKYKTDNMGNVDFKSIGHVVSVKENEVIAKRIVGREGSIGIDIFAKAINPRKRKVKDMIIKSGCKFLDSNTIVATVEGNPQVKGAVFQVSNVHEVAKDVDMGTGNINFVGDVNINGSVSEGMSVKVGNKLFIRDKAIRCNLWSEGDLTIKGSAISSTIKVKSEFSELKEYVESLNVALDIFRGIFDGTKSVKHSNALQENVTDGMIIKLIIESKYPMFTREIRKLTENMAKNNNATGDLYNLLKIKYVTRNYRLISSINEIELICNLISDKIRTINSMKDVKSNAELDYVQDCEIYVSGNIFVEGKGVYKSNIHADEGIYFVGDGYCDLRGGRLFAEKEIKVKNVGAPTGVTTELVVGKEGHIYCDVAHFNTKMQVGHMAIILEESCKNVHVYMDKNRELVVDKLKL